MSKTLTAEIMADIKVPAGAQISPDGTRIAVSIGTNAKKGEHREAAIWLIGVGDPDSGRQITAGTANDTAPRWSPDGLSISFLSDRAKRGTSQLYLLPLDEGGEARRLTDERGGVSSHAWLGDDNRIAYLSPDARDPEEEKRRKEERDDANVWGEFWPYARLRVLDLATDGTRKVDLGDRHISGMSPSPDGSRIAVTMSEFPDLDSIGTSCELLLVDAVTGEADMICAPDRMFSSLTWSADETAIYGEASAGPVPAVSSNQLWRIAAEKGAEPELLTPDLHGCVRSLARGRDAATLHAIVQVGVETDIFAYDIASGEFSRKHHFPGDLSELSVADDGGLAVTLGSTINRPFDVYSVNLSGGEDSDPFTRLTDLHQYLDDIEFGPHEIVTWERGGFTLDGIVLWPAGKSAADGPLPTCVSVHGGPYGRWANAFGYARPFAHWLAAQGYLVFMPNARGGSGHGEAFASAVLDSVGKEDWPDILAGIDLVVDNGWANPDRMAIGGWSQGGFMTAWAVGHDPDDRQRFKCAVMGAGVSDWGMMVATSDVPTFEQRLGGGNPYESAGPHEFHKWSPISYVHRATTPTLILHGEKDERVPLSQAIFMHRGLRKYGCETEMVVYPREPHGLQERRHVIDLHQRVASWYREKL
ncbi:MAG: S9 family peptidase [Thermomicrobiales bacterium]